MNSPWVKEFIVGHTIKKLTEHGNGSISIHFENGEHLRIAPVLRAEKCSKYCSHTESVPDIMATPFKAKGKGVKGIDEINQDKLIRRYIRAKKKCGYCSNLKVNCAFCTMLYNKAFRQQLEF